MPHGVLVDASGQQQPERAQPVERHVRDDAGLEVAINDARRVANATRDIFDGA